METVKQTPQVVMVTPVANDSEICIVTIPNSRELPQVLKIDDLPEFLRLCRTLNS